MRFSASTTGTETWHEGRGQAHEVIEHGFDVTPSMVEGHPGVKLH